MKKLVFGLILVLSACCVKAQDVIVKKDNSTILSKVTKVSQIEIEYKKWSNLDGPTYTINISDVSSINYENGERDIFDMPIETFDETKQMIRVGRNLVLNHVILSDDEVRSLFDENKYNTYVSARTQKNVGEFFAGVFIGSLVWDIIGITNILLSTDIYELKLWANYTYIGALISDISCPLWLVFSGIGKGRLNWLADEYNKQHQGYSLNLSPSLIRCNTPQLQNNYGLGLTLSLNF